MAEYAAATSVTVERSKAELDTLLRRYGASQRGTFDDDEKGEAGVFFTMAKRQIRLVLPLPKLGSFPALGEAPRGWHAWREARRKEWSMKQWEQACRARWRALVLVIKAKLELIAIGVSSVEREFLADLQLPDGRSVHAALEASIASAYETGSNPPSLMPYRGPTIVEAEVLP